MAQGDFRRWRVGDVTITRIFDLGEAPVDPGLLFPEVTPQTVREHAWLQPHFADASGQIIMSFHAFVIEAGTRRIIVDTCIGNDKPRKDSVFHMLQTSFLDDLSAAGYPPESIDTVICTHLHADHVGWNTRLVDGRWVPTFPNARHFFVKAEVDHCRGREDEHFGDVFGDSVQPVMDAGLADLIGPDHLLAEGIRLMPTPGHTPGHVSVRISSRGEEAIITGDMAHHPIQCALPEASTHFCFDPAMAAATRRRFFSAVAGKPVLILGTHFGGPTAGYVEAHDAVWRFTADDAKA